ncbi:oxygen-independent coproporphyrinogen-3 oxidase [Mongoliibacter ruber]|uniref:Heme chaperone HemW n=2 Tax=Mongoliibacter ruber TaxID=1750599 RepID=A0A2T0WRA2_9BACT|nr:oxygen-independent coproporphyrinogen-3 oxidase [Mongoliibacter ruber]
MDTMVRMLCEEIALRKTFFKDNSPIESIYFGGGTPSILQTHHLDLILNAIYSNYRLDIKELTLEANPDDLNTEKLKGFKKLGFNRLSIGIQSFDQQVLEFYNRAHSAKESLIAIDLAKSAGFEKLSVDLIYGYPHHDHSIWQKDLLTALSLDPGHISSYALTIEPKTALGNWSKKGKFQEASEDFVAEQFELLVEESEKAGYVQYEISNFGKEGHFALHNSSYWKNIPYLGVGPGAHSYDGNSRGANIANNNLYIKKLQLGELPFEIEPMEQSDSCNEYILTSLRTIWGTDLNYLKEKFGVDLLSRQETILLGLQKEGLIAITEDKITLSKKGKILADGIAASLFID